VKRELDASRFTFHVSPDHGVDRIWPSDSRSRASRLIGDRSLVDHELGGHLLADERDHILEALELALVPAADVLDAATPYIAALRITALNDKA
jgi:hypothetical protein